MKIELSKATEQELATIAKLAHTIWQAHYPSIVGQAQVDYMLNKFYDLKALTKQSEEGQLFCLIHGEAGVIGFISFTRNGDSMFFINKFYLLPGTQGQGLGEIVMGRLRTIFLSALENDRVRTPLVINLTVNRMNYKAINFYFKTGFRIKEVADFDIGNGFFMNDFVMEWRHRTKN